MCRFSLSFVLQEEHDSNRSTDPRLAVRRCSIDNRRGMGECAIPGLDRPIRSWLGCAETACDLDLLSASGPRRSFVRRIPDHVEELRRRFRHISGGRAAGVGDAQHFLLPSLIMDPWLAKGVILAAGIAMFVHSSASWVSKLQAQGRAKP